MTLQSAEQSKKASRLVKDLLTPVEALERPVEALEAVESIRYIKLSEVNVSNPPTAAQLTAEFGAPVDVGKGFIVGINDNGAGANVYLVLSDGTSWWIFSGSVAV